MIYIFPLKGGSLITWDGFRVVYRYRKAPIFLRWSDCSEELVELASLEMSERYTLRLDGGYAMLQCGGIVSLCRFTLSGVWVLSVIWRVSLKFLGCRSVIWDVSGRVFCVFSVASTWEPYRWMEMCVTMTESEGSTGVFWDCHWSIFILFQWGGV